MFSFRLEIDLLQASDLNIARWISFFIRFRHNKRPGIFDQVHPWKLTAKCFNTEQFFKHPTWVFPGNCHLSARTVRVLYIYNHLHMFINCWFFFERYHTSNMHVWGQKTLISMTDNMVEVGGDVISCTWSWHLRPLHFKKLRMAGSRLHRRRFCQ